MSHPVVFPDLWSRNENGEVDACPCLALTIYLDETDRAQVLAFYQRALEALRPHLTHYLAERMRQPAPITPRALGTVPTWVGRPKEAHEYQISLWGGDAMDVSPWSIDIVYTDIPPNPERRARMPQFLAEREKTARDGQPEIPGTVLRVTVPVDSALAEPQAWVRWVLDFDIISRGQFMSAESGYSATSRGDLRDKGFVRAACSRYPGLDWFSPRHVLFMRRYEASTGGVLFKIKRAAWLTFVSAGAVAFLGGGKKIEAEMADDPAIVLHPLAHGLGIQAGPQPELGDLSRLDVPPRQRRVARLLRPVRLDGVPLAYYEEFVSHWFNMFDEDHAAGPPW